MFEKIKQIIKEKYGDKAHLYEPKEEVDRGVNIPTPSREQIQSATMPEYKTIGSPRFDDLFNFFEHNL